jgi:ribose 5-phosphate isomerase B
MKVIIGSDHAGFSYKALLIDEMKRQGYEVLDLGTDSGDNEDDYPDHAADVATAIINKQGAKGILVCGSAVGVSIAANKFKGIRAGVCHDTYSAHQSVEHDDVNILCIGQRVIGIELAKDIVFTFLKAHFTGAPRHTRRLEKLFAIENKTMKEEIL